MRYFLILLLLCFSYSCLAKEECIPKTQIQDALNSGVLDSIFKQRILLENSLEHLELINGIRATLRSSDEDQLIYLNLIDSQTNAKLDEISMAIYATENREFFLSKKKRILAFISWIKALRKDSKSRVEVDQNALYNLESSINAL
jgi:hypothetical protein